MVALRSLTDDERADTLAELAATRRVRANMAGFLLSAKGPLRVKLDWQIQACDRWIDTYQRELGRD